MLVGESNRSSVTVGIRSDGMEVAVKRIRKRILSATAPDPATPMAEHTHIGNYKVCTAGIAKPFHSEKREFPEYVQIVIA